MKICIVSLFLPYEKASHAGGRFVFEMLKILSRQNEIYLVTRLEESEFPFLDSLRPYCREIHHYSYKTTVKRDLLEAIRLIINYIGFSRFADRIINNGNFDIVQVEWVEAGLMLKKRKVPMIVDAHDVITKPAERNAGNARGLRKCTALLLFYAVKHLELFILNKFDMIFTRSDYDRKYLLNFKRGSVIDVIPHPAGLDITEREYGIQGNTILFLASYKYRRVNVNAVLYFYNEIFPLVREKVPDAVFIAAGYGPPEELRSLADNNSHIQVPGFVDNIDKCYKQAAVFVAPILVGGGIIVKILDAMAAGKPVVTTSYGNEGIGALSDRDLLVKDDPESFAAAVIKLMTDQDFASQLAQNGRKFVRQHYSPEALVLKLEESYHDLLQRRS